MRIIFFGQISISVLFIFSGEINALRSCSDRSNDCPQSNSDYFNQYDESTCSGFHIRDGIQAQITFMNQEEVS